MRELLFGVVVANLPFYTSLAAARTPLYKRKESWSFIVHKVHTDIYELSLGRYLPVEMSGCLPTCKVIQFADSTVQLERNGNIAHKTRTTTTTTSE